MKQIQLKLTEAQAKDALQQLVDGFMFAGMLGTTHLVTHTLDRIRKRPSTYVDQYKSNSKSFLLESARLDPPGKYTKSEGVSIANGAL